MPTVFVRTTDACKEFVETADGEPTLTRFPHLVSMLELTLKGFWLTQLFIIKIM